MLLLIGLADFKEEKKSLVAVNTPEFPWSNILK